MDKLILEFMKNTNHRHIFVNDVCKFCEIYIDNCKHDGLNLEKSKLGNQKILCKCLCGKFSKEKLCTHNPKYIVEVLRRPKNYDHFCNKCCTYIK